MAQAFVLINCELGSEEHIISELKTFDDIEEVHGSSDEMIPLFQKAFSRAK